MVPKNHVQCDNKFLFDQFKVDETTISIVLYANKRNVKRYLKDVYDPLSLHFSETFKEGLKRLDEYQALEGE